MLKYLPVFRSISYLPMLVLVLALFSTARTNAQVTNLPTRGKKFWAGYLYNTSSGAANLRVHIASRFATSGTVSVPLGSWSVPYTVTANGVTIVDVPTTFENNGSGNIASKGVLITSNDSVNVHISSYQSLSHDVAQVLPVSSLGSYYRVDAAAGILGIWKSELLIVATEDGTQIEITPSVNVLGGIPAGVPYTITLNAGQSYQAQAATDALDLTGTTIKALANSVCKPFAVFGGSQCASMPTGCSACDIVFDQMRPIGAWGKRYFTLPVNGVTSTAYRVLANEDGTSVTIAGGAPTTLNAGQVLTFTNTNTPACIVANKPISVVQILQGVACAGGGDPSLVVLSPADRLTKRASFKTLVSTSLNQHSITIVMPPAGIGQLLLDGAPVAASFFNSYATCSDRVHAKIPITAGVHTLSSTVGFQVYSFGLGYGESYGTSVNDIAAVPMATDSLICSPGPVTLTAPEPLTNAQWTAATAPTTILATGNTYAFTPTSSDSYTVTGGSSTTGCPRSFTYHIGVPLNTPPEPTANGTPAVTICQFATVQLGLSPLPNPSWFNVQWSPAASLNDPNSPTPIATPSATTWYRYTISSPAGCGTYTDSVLVTVLPMLVRDLETFVNDTNICSGESVQISSKAYRIFATDRFSQAPQSFWSAIQGGAVSAACGSITGTALYFNGAGQRYAQTNSYNTTGGGRVEFYLKVAQGTAPCENADAGENIQFQYSTDNGISWNTPTDGTFDQDNYPTFLPVSIELPLAAQGPNVSFRIRQVIHSGANQDNWAIDDVVLSRVDNSWLTYNWTPTNTAPTAANTTASPTTSGWYFLNVIDPTAGCTFTDSVHIEVGQAFNLSVTPNTTLCTPTATQLNATPNSGTGIEYTWSTTNGVLSATNIANPIANATTTATYTVQATNAIGCVANGSTIVTIAPALNLTLQADNSTLCQGATAQLTAVGTGATGLVYSWSGAGLSATNIANPVASPTQTTTYTCTITNPANNCTKSSTITITVNTGYTANAGLDREVCSAIGQVLNVTHNVPNPIYAWTPAASLSNPALQSPTITIEGSQTFTITVSDANGCSVTDTIVITKAYANLPATQTLTGCGNVTNTLTAPATGTNYQWTTPNGPGPSGPSAQTMNATVAGAHTLTITNAQGCTGTTTFNVTLLPVPQVDLGPDVELCGASNHVLNAGNVGSTFLWSPSGTTQSITTITSGNYSVTVTNGSGCSASDQVHVQFNAMPTDALQNVNGCVDAPPTLNAANAGATYLWNTGANSQSIVADTNGTYTVVVTTPQQCSATFDAVVNLQPILSVNLGNDTTICQGQTVVLDAGTPGATHAWSNNTSTQTLTVGTTGTYSVTISNGGCSATDAINVTVTPMPVDVLQDVTACITTPPTLNAGNAGATYLWSNTLTTPSITPTSSGTYTVVVTTPQNCSATFDAVVNLTPTLSVDLGNDTTICAGSSLVLNAGTPSATHTWNTNATTQSITVSTTDIYSVTLSNGGCTATDQISVTVAPMPVNTLSDMVTCIDQPITLNAGNPGSTYQWNNGPLTQSITPTVSGAYSVTVTTPQSCTATFNSDVTISPLIDIDLGNDTTLCAGATLVLDVTTPQANYNWSTTATTPTLSVTQAGTYGVTVSNAGCSAQDEVIVHVVPAPVDQLVDVTVCVAQGTTLNAGNAGSTYAWSSGQTTQSITPATSGTYTVVVTNLIGCIGTFDAIVDLVPMPILSLGTDTILCDGQELELDATNPGATYNWSTGATTQKIKVTIPGTYTVTVNNGYCSEQASIVVGFNPSPTRLSVHNVTTCLDEQPNYVVISAENTGADYSWNTGETTQTIKADTYGWYSVLVTNQYDCAIRDSIRVSEYCPSTIFMPNSFTPNGDGINDVFLPVGTNIGTVHFTIFDRWGEMVFESSDMHYGWDGTYQGLPAKNDIYSWKLEYKFIDEHGELGVQQKLIGSVQVLL